MTDQRIYVVPESNYQELKDGITRLQRRAKKLGCEEIVLTEVGHEDHQGYRVSTSAGTKVYYLKPCEDPYKHFGVDDWRTEDLVHRFYHLTISGPSPILNGWTFIGAIDVIRDDDNKVIGNMVRSLPGHEMPDSFRSVKPYCDHCKVDRRWKSTYVVMHENGTYNQVGRNCLKDFTGHKDPEALAALAELMMSLEGLMGDSEMDDEDWGMGGGRRHERFKVLSILTRVATIVRTDGWISKLMADIRGISSTAGDLRSWLYANGKDAEKLDKHYQSTEGDIETAKATFEWMLSLPEKEKLSDYEYNLGLFALAGSIEGKAFGFVASAIPAYMRAHEREVNALLDRENSNHVGEVKKRMEMVLTLVSLRYLDSEFGTRTMCKFRDEQGNVIVWWASSSIDMQAGTKIKAKATVKKHDAYNGVKQTIVTRLDVLETLPETEEPAKAEEKVLVA